MIDNGSYAILVFLCVYNSSVRIILHEPPSFILHEPLAYSIHLLSSSAIYNIAYSALRKPRPCSPTTKHEQFASNTPNLLYLHYTKTRAIFHINTHFQPLRKSSLYKKSLESLRSVLSIGCPRLGREIPLLCVHLLKTKR